MRLVRPGEVSSDRSPVCFASRESVEKLTSRLPLEIWHETRTARVVSLQPSALWESSLVS
ncbi:MAG: hypothetical protein ACYTFI_13120 [Planctomycetota bacterium]|jgi:hypothetical protein